MLSITLGRPSSTLTADGSSSVRHESRTEIVKWCAENLRPFKIVSDQGFQCLMKTGCPGYYLPSPATVSRDVKAVFVRTHTRIAKLLQVSTLP
ncbi:hypothetical protein C8Q80DRAFT_1098397 [Daedaleopsis nitida]|nr:hypothetical protein C8Q80DRAFT_1098397 [Daedaleopsis nitida]